MIKACYIKNSHGIHGAIKVKILLEDYDLFLQQEYLYDEEENKFNIQDIYGTYDNAIMEIEGFDNIDKTELLKGKFLYLPVQLLPELDNNAYYLHEIEGINVFYEESHIGNVHRLIDYGAGPMIEISNFQHYIPFDDEYINLIDIEQNKLCLKNLPEYI